MNQPIHLHFSELRVPLKMTFRHASAARTHGESLWVEAARGAHRGYGEGCPRAVRHAGDAGIVQAVVGHLAGGHRVRVHEPRTRSAAGSRRTPATSTHRLRRGAQSSVRCSISSRVSVGRASRRCSVCRRRAALTCTPRCSATTSRGRRGCPDRSVLHPRRHRLQGEARRRSRGRPAEAAQHRRADRAGTA